MAGALEVAVHSSASRAYHDVKSAGRAIEGFAAGWIAATWYRKATDISAGNLRLLDGIGLRPVMGRALMFAGCFRRSRQSNQSAECKGKKFHR